VQDDQNRVVFPDSSTVQDDEGDTDQVRRSTMLTRQPISGPADTRVDSNRYRRTVTASPVEETQACLSVVREKGLAVKQREYITGIARQLQSASGHALLHNNPNFYPSQGAGIPMRAEGPEIPNTRRRFPISMAVPVQAERS